MTMLSFSRHIGVYGPRPTPRKNGYSNLHSCVLLHTEWNLKSTPRRRRGTSKSISVLIRRFCTKKWHSPPKRRRIFAATFKNWSSSPLASKKIPAPPDACSGLSQRKIWRRNSSTGCSGCNKVGPSLGPSGVPLKFVCSPGLRRRQSGSQHPKRRARHIIHSHLVAEFNR